jgi:hypothetical protein
VQTHLADVFSFHKLGWHHVSDGSIVVPIAVGGPLAGLSPDEVRSATGLAAAHGLMVDYTTKGEIGMVKAAGYPLMSVSALQAVHLARHGFSGTADGVERLLRAIGYEGDAADVAGFDGDWDRVGVEGVSVLGLFEAVDLLLGGGGRDAVSGVAGFDRLGDRQVRLVGAGRPEEADVRVLLGPGQLREVEDQRLLGGGLGGEVGARGSGVS